MAVECCWWRSVRSLVSRSRLAGCRSALGHRVGAEPSLDDNLRLACRDEPLSLADAAVRRLAALWNDEQVRLGIFQYSQRWIQRRIGGSHVRCNWTARV